MIGVNKLYPFSNPYSTMSSKLSPRAISQDCKEWNLFLEMNYFYMQESWPEKYKHIDQSTFIKDYAEKLTERIKEGNRGLFLYYRFKDPVGFSNVYLTELEKKKILNIAEFYVVPEWRRQKFGNEILYHIITWGKERGAKELRIEVDKHLEKSNRFWSSFGYDLDCSGQRNVYFSKI